eukprot:6349648-Ditylum_brightwellii.AAC.1
MPSSMPSSQPSSMPSAMPSSFPSTAFTLSPTDDPVTSTPTAAPFTPLPTPAPISAPEPTGGLPTPSSNIVDSGIDEVVRIGGSTSWGGNNDADKAFDGTATRYNVYNNDGNCNWSS